MDYLTKCRLCLNDIEEIENSVPLYIRSENEAAKQLDEDVVLMISYCVSVQIDNIATLPSHVCVNCFEDLKRCNEFKKKCQDSDVELRKYTGEGIADSNMVQVKDEADSDDKIIWPLLTPLVTLTEGAQADDAKQTPSENDVKETEKQKKSEDRTKIRIKNVTELNGKCEIKSEAKSDLVQSKKNKVNNDDGFDEDAPLSDILENMVKKESKRGKYRCSYCDETFRRQVAKQVHEKEHRVLYKCVLCYESFQTHLKLQKHRAEVHNEDPYCCSFCSKSFSDVHTWTDHLKKNHVCCSKCRSYFKTQGDLDKHICLKKALLSKGCSPEELQNRIQYDFPNSNVNYKKPKCGAEKKRYTPKKNYYQLKKMRLLAAAHSTEFVTVNTPPDDKFLTEDGNKRGPFPCFRCDKDFSDKGSLICHQAVAHPGQPIDNTQRPPKKSVLFCKFCLSFFRHVSDMNAHYCQNSLYSLKQPNPLALSNLTQAQPLSRIDASDKAYPIPLSLIRKSFRVFTQGENVKTEPMSPLRQEGVEKKPVMQKLLPPASMSKIPYETEVRLGYASLTPSISKMFDTTPPTNQMIKQEVHDEEEQEMSSSSQKKCLRPDRKRKPSEDEIESAESVFKVNPNILATLGIRQDTSL